MKVLSIFLLLTAIFAVCTEGINRFNKGIGQQHASSYPIKTRFTTVTVDNNNSSQVPILTYRMAMPASRIGNFLGFYFEALACADVIGVHFKAVDDGQLINHFEQYVRSPVKDDRLRYFINALPHNHDAKVASCSIFILNI